MNDFPKWYEKDVPFSIFTWTMGFILIVISVVFAQQAQLSSRLDRFDDKMTSLDGGQSDIKEWLIRIDERQQVNSKGIDKIVNKLNIQ